MDESTVVDKLVVVVLFDDVCCVKLVMKVDDEEDCSIDVREEDVPIFKVDH